MTELVKISELPVSTTGITSGTVIPVVQGGQTRSVSHAQLLTFVQSNSSGGTSSSNKVGFAVLGDSLSFSTSDYELSWPNKIQFFSLGRNRFRLNSSIDSAPLQQLQNAALTAITNLVPMPKQCIIAGGTYNLDTDANLTTGLSSLTTIINTLLAAGIDPILWTVPPALSSSRRVRVARWNSAIAVLAVKYNLQVLDAFNFFQDPTTGLGKPSLYMDDLKPNDVGHASFAKWISDTRFLVEDSVPVLAPSNVFPSNLISNGWFLIPNGSNPGLADGWGASPEINGVLSIEPDPDNGGFNWQKQVQPAGLAIEGYLSLSVSNIIPNQRYRFSCLVQFEKPENLNYFNAALNIVISDASWATLTSFPVGQRPTLAVEKGYLQFEFVAPATSQNLSVVFDIKNTLGTLTSPFTVKMAKPYLFSVTDTGVTP